MAAPRCNASSRRRVALSLALFIISGSKTPAMHRLWGEKKTQGEKKPECTCVCKFTRVHLCPCSQCCGIGLCVSVCVCVHFFTASILNSFGGDCAGCHEYKRTHPSWWNTISQVVTVKSDSSLRLQTLRRKAEEAAIQNGSLVICGTPIGFPAASRIGLSLSCSHRMDSTEG